MSGYVIAVYALPTDSWIYNNYRLRSSDLKSSLFLGAAPYLQQSSQTYSTAYKRECHDRHNMANSSLADYCTDRAY